MVESQTFEVAKVLQNALVMQYFVDRNSRNWRVRRHDHGSTDAGEIG
jgi:hypothetical protein